jgi:hypothetical protein
MNLNFSHHRGVSPGIESKKVCDGRRIIYARLAQEQLSAASEFIGCKGCAGSGQVE